MSLTAYYEFNKPTGSDLVNPLIDQIPNWDIADAALHGLSINSIGSAVEVVSLGVHALTRINQPDAKFFAFIATGDYDAGETFTLDGVAINAAFPDGSSLTKDCYVTGATVLVGLNADNTLLTFYLSSVGGTAPDSLRLGGELPSYYATKSYADNIKETADTAATAISKKALVNTYFDTSDGKLYRVLSDGTVGSEIKLSKYTTLSSATISATGTYALDDDINNYDTLLVVHQKGTNDSYKSDVVDVAIFKTGVQFYFDSNENAGNRQIALKYSDDTHVQCSYQYTERIVKIVGIKY